MIALSSALFGRRQQVLPMPYRMVISTELAKLFSVLSNQKRVRIVEELSRGELSVNDLQSIMGITHAAVSQQLAVLRSNRIVLERREGRNVFYHLKDPDLAAWVLAGIKFISPSQQEIEHMMSAIDKAKLTWTHASEEAEKKPPAKKSPKSKKS